MQGTTTAVHLAVAALAVHTTPFILYRIQNPTDSESRVNERIKAVDLWLGS
jgi:hypothetical protein